MRGACYCVSPFISLFQIIKKRESISLPQHFRFVSFVLNKIQIFPLLFLLREYPLLIFQLLERLEIVNFTRKVSSLFRAKNSNLKMTGILSIFE